MGRFPVTDEQAHLPAGDGIRLRDDIPLFGPDRFQIEIASKPVLAKVTSMSPELKTHAHGREAAVACSNPCPPPSSRRDWIFGLLLVFAVIVAYLPAMRGGFVWDDDEHISNNQMLHSLRGLWEIWFQPGATCQYYPLTFTAFWAGYHLWGLNPPGYHLLNVVLHSLVAVLLWQVLMRLKMRGAWLAGAMFALHPVCVMSVAWMTELKNTLSASLALGAGWAYLRFAGLGVYEAADVQGGHPQRPGSGKHWRFYVLSMGLFQLALFAKTAISFLPVSLLLVTWWRRERLRWRDVWPLIPMLGLVVAMGQLTFSIEHLHGAAGEPFRMGFTERVLVSGRSFWFYLGKLFFPYPLTFIYERWQVDARVAWQYLYPIATAALLAGLWRGRRRIGKGPLVALLHFYVCTSLLILLVVLYMTRYSFVSDHWQYFGCMSVIALAASGITAGFNRFENGKPFLRPGLGGALLLVLGVLTWKQCGMYADIEKLWRTTLDRNPNSSMAHLNLGIVLAQKGSVDEAITHFQRTLEIKPDYAKAHNDLGLALLQKGKVDEAIARFQKVIEIDPAYAEACYNLGNALIQKGSVDEAIAQYQKALQIRPDYAEACYNLGNALIQRGSVDEAITRYQKALQIKPDYAEAHNNLGKTLFNKGSVDAAIVHYQKALQIKPDHANACYNLGIALLQKGKVDEAITCLHKVLRVKPDFSEAQNDLAWVLATSSQASVRNGNQAVELARQANQLSGQRNPAFLRTLAAAQAEAGRFGDALRSAQKAMDLARSAGRQDLVEKLNGELKLYEAGLPFHQESN
jgi:protein O-mannosyl-transferase